MRKELLQRAFVMEEADIQPFPLFFLQVCTQHERSEWRGIDCARYHTYLIPKNHGFPDATASPYGHSIHDKSRADAQPVKKVGGSKKADVDVEDSEDESSEKNDSDLGALRH